MNKEPITGQTFAQTSAVIRRCEDVTLRVARLNHDGWRQNRDEEFFWRLVIPVKIDTMDASDEDLALSMLLRAKEIIDDRIASLTTPKDGAERVTPKYEIGVDVRCPFDLRTSEGRAWKAAQKEEVTA